MTQQPTETRVEGTLEGVSALLVDDEFDTLEVLGTMLRLEERRCSR
ncbi:MAG: hypothetical protein H0V09_08225 [Gemmatimonadetes bacterium]|nr:hypothetical protein [Gemmatimonadota bacterium]